MATTEEPPVTEDAPNLQGAPASMAANLAVAPELMAGSLSQYLRAWLARLKAGESGTLPVVGGLILISILFQTLNSLFLTAGNLVNLLVQGSGFMLLAMAEIFALLLGEIDLSIGFVSGIGGVVMAELVKDSTGYPWWAAIILGLLACAFIGFVQGTIITRLGLPSFVVTLAGLLGMQGLMLQILGKGGEVPINQKIINDLAGGNLTNAASWVVMLAIVGIFGLRAWFRDARRRKHGLVAPPPSLTLAKIGFTLAAGVVVVWICNTDRGTRFKSISGVPWVVLIVLGVLGIWTFLLGRTRYGRYVYAIGGNAEAARRAGVNLARIRTIAFTLAGLTAGIAGMIFASRLRSVSTSIDGGQLVLDAVAAAVIGGTSLFGGRGKALHGVLGGLVIAAINNGMGLQGYSGAATDMVTALVLLLAVMIDALARRSSTPR